MATSVRHELKEHGLNVELGPYRGGMGEVYEAVSPRHGRVAVKLVRSDCQDEIVTQRFQREIHLLRRLKGASRIVQLLEVGRLNDGREFVVMDYVGMLSLLDLILDTHALDEFDEPPSADEQHKVSRTLLNLAYQLSDALCQLHERRVVHRDFNPANVMLRIEDPDAYERTFQLTVFDFGISDLSRGDDPQDEKDAQDMPELSFGAGGLGTPGFIAPEQDIGMAAHPSADLWSFGASLLYMITGQERKDRELYCNIYPSRPEHHVLGWIHDLALMCLNTDAKQRPTAPAVRQHIQGFIRSLREQTKPVARTQVNVVTEPVQSFQAIGTPAPPIQPANPIPAAPPPRPTRQANPSPIPSLQPSPGPFDAHPEHSADMASNPATHTSQTRRRRRVVLSLTAMVAAVVTVAAVVMWQSPNVTEIEPPGVVLAAAVDDGGARPDENDETSKDDDVVPHHDEVTPEPRALKTSTTSDEEGQPTADPSELEPPRPKPVPSTPVPSEQQTTKSLDQDTSPKAADKHQKSNQRAVKKPKPQRSAEDCEALVASFEQARRRRATTEMLRLTKPSNKICWSSVAAWEVARVQTLIETGQYQECKKLGEAHSELGRTLLQICKKGDPE